LALASAAPAGRQNQPSGFRLHQRERVAENHQRQGPEDRRRSPVTLDGTAERNGKHQAEEGVNGHEAAGEDSVVAVIRQQHGQHHRQLELLIGRQEGEAQAEGDADDVIGTRGGRHTHPKLTQTGAKRALK
jgi:hypothetical protein